MSGRDTAADGEPHVLSRQNLQTTISFPLCWFFFIMRAKLWPRFSRSSMAPVLRQGGKGGSHGHFDDDASPKQKRPKMRNWPSTRKQAIFAYIFITLAFLAAAMRHEKDGRWQGFGDQRSRVSLCHQTGKFFQLRWGTRIFWASSWRHSIGM